jgi:hypothetical protein
MQGSHLTLSGRYRRNNGCWRNAAHDVLSPASLKAPQTPTVDDNSADTLRSDTGVQTGYAARKLDQYAAQKVSHLWGGYSTPIGPTDLFFSAPHRQDREALWERWETRSVSFPRLP